MTNDTLSKAPVSKAPVQPDQPARDATTDRCHELARTERGWERCHRDEHSADGRHHVRDRSWLSTVSSPLLQLGQPCTGACQWPDQIQPYRGTAKGRHY